MPYIQREDASLYYETYGTGQPLVFPHGRGASSLPWWQQVNRVVEEFLQQKAMKSERAETRQSRWNLEAGPKDSLLQKPRGDK